MPQFRKLARVLEKELALQERILELLGRERAAIVKLNQERVEEINREKERLLNDLRLIEDDRRRLMSSIPQGRADGSAVGPEPAEGRTLTAILPRCADPAMRQQLAALAQDLKETVSTVRELNAQNGVLVKQSLGLIASTLAILGARPEAALPTYGQSGKLSSDKEDPAFAPRTSSFTKAA